MNSSRLDASRGCTCVTCRLVFANSALQKEHYCSEWHRYNAKRQVAGLPPITEELFVVKVETFNKAGNEPKKAEQEKTYCKECRKSFQTKNSYSNHLNSKKHKQSVDDYVEKPAENIVETIEEEVVPQVGNKRYRNFDSESSSGSWETAVSDEDLEDDNYDESNALPETSCLFCCQDSKTLDDNITHMSNLHGFFIPDAQYCSNPSGLINYLNLKVTAGFYCIRCTRKRFPDLHACQLHMKDKSHYTFSMEGSRVVEYLDFYDYGDLLTDEDCMDDNVAIDTGFTLILPSGAKIGHRSLMRYYKQSLRSNEDEAKIIKGRAAYKLNAPQCKALGWTGTTGTAAVQKARDLKFVKTMMNKDMLRRGMHFNKLFRSKGRDDQM